MRSKDSKSPFDAVTDFNKGSTCGRRVEEQNPETKSRWAQMAREGKRVMYFLSEGRYIANVVKPAGGDLSHSGDFWPPAAGAVLVSFAAGQQDYSRYVSERQHGLLCVDPGDFISSSSASSVPRWTLSWIGIPLSDRT